jgi:hypothetical protein
VFQRFSEQARRVVVDAQDEARARTFGAALGIGILIGWLIWG